MKKEKARVKNTTGRKRKAVYLFVAEGRNKTETLYFQSFQKQYSDFVIKFAKAGNVTDPEGLYQVARTKWDELELSKIDGDRVFVVLDLDNDEEKAKQVVNFMAKSKYVEFIVSNPCFEVWFIMHFSDSAKQYASSKAVVKEMGKYIPQYDKNRDISIELKDRIETALHNSMKLARKYEDEERKWPSAECNPRTDVGMVVELVREK